MARTAIQKRDETDVLVQSRRRCAMCFGLNRDTSLKNGQIAHIDRNSANSDSGNLVFLCFDHHDEYDSKSSQRKGLTTGELKTFKAELLEAVGRTFSQAVHFGELSTPPADPYAGQYIRIGSEDNSAEIVLTPLPDTYEGSPRYFVSGLAIWGARREFGPNLGIIDFVGVMDVTGFLTHNRPHFDDTISTTELRFIQAGFLEVSEDNWLGQYGMNVNFIGTYMRAGTSH